MRQKKYVSPISFCLMAVGLSVWIVPEKLAVAEIPEPTMMACNQDSDCALVSTDCCPCNNGGDMGAIHIDQKAEYENLWQQKCAYSDTSSPHLCRAWYRCNDFSVQCVDSQCQATEKGLQKLFFNIKVILNGVFTPENLPNLIVVPEERTAAETPDIATIEATRTCNQDSECVPGVGAGGE